MTRINTNVSSLNAQNSLARSNSQLQEALTRLSTGLRINTGKDDPAGLIASEVLRSDITSTNKAISNTQRANQIIATADSALGQVSNLLNDIRSLIEEGANSGAMSSDQIAANQLQIDSSLSAINRISQTTKFQGRALLDGSLDFISSASSVTSMVDLQINQANLGAAGQVDVNVEISAAAAQAKIESASGTAKAQAVVKFSPEYAYAADAVVTGKELGIKAKALGAAYEGAKVTISDTGSASVTWDAVAKTLVIGVDEGTSTYADIKDDLAAAGFEFFAVDDDTAIADADEINAAGEVTLVNKTLTVDALSAGATYNGMQVSIVESNAVTATEPRAAYYADTNRLIIEVSDAGDTAMSDIEDAINDNTALNTLFSATADTSATGASDNFEYESAADVRARASTLNSGFAVSGFSSATNANATLSFAASAKIAVSGGGGDSFFIRSKALGASAGDVRITFQDTTGVGGSETATYDANAKTLIVTYESTESTQQNILDAINALDEWEATSDGADLTDTVGAAQSAGITGVDSLNISSVIAGANFNQMKIALATEAGLTTPRAAYNSTANQLTVTINSSAVTSLSAIADAINGVDGFAAGVNFKGARDVNGGDVDATAAANTGSTGGNLLLSDLVMNVGGLQGTEVFKFTAGTAVNEIANAINLVKDATGVAANQSNGLLTVKSEAYGSKAFTAVNVVSESVGGTFKRALSADRATGTDIQARINGFDANANGNQFALSVSTLDVSMEVNIGTTGNFSFAITGGGALFQMGPEVVTNQQARIGIGSMNTASLRGATGRLYQLGSGNSADLATDAGKAAKIVDEVISKVTSLRGRLGAFQRTALDTNIQSLTDTVQNLTAAQSDIRDADFASESAKLTRSQILVQSGMKVLALSNQQPQQVLALLQ